MSTEDKTNLNKTYIPKIKAVLQSMDLTFGEQRDRITRILNVFLRESPDYEYAVEQICFRVKLAEKRFKDKAANAYLEKDLKDALRRFLFELIKKRGLMKGKNFCVSIKARKPHEKKLIYKCKQSEIPEEYLKLVPDIDKIKQLLEEKGAQDWVEYNADSLYSLWITKPSNQYVPYKPYKAKKYYY